MKKSRRIIVSLWVVAILALTGTWWAKHGASSPTEAAVVPATVLSTSSLGSEAAGGILTGQVGAGDNHPLLARSKGRVKKLFFTGGEYVHRGDVLIKLYNYSFVLAPRNGFLGQLQVYQGQYLTPTTTVTTISQKDHLVVVLPPQNHLAAFHPGDSVRVWVATRPARVVTGIVSPFLPLRTGPSAVEIMLGPGAPFRLGEQAQVRLSKATPALAADLPTH